ncbi:MULTISPECIES: sulfotransferase domain-containing protein [Halomonadaceae]|uniref:sulfotransferase domain-containing protein n=1 Tax=Halomonadaceae TaxID=28256 RepID=UPI0015836A53|nr:MULTISPECIES: sulfotransferase domain-containing protein [Halomonas]MDI4637799.1 sulfotransferase domain-containing protein [Halomonas sp. BMC7]NUJ58820.1 sulfotransferase domain-containing protein [Halomonas taeanensis]
MDPTPQKETTYIISYPKSGRTWLRAIIGKFISLKYGIDESRMLEVEELTRELGLNPVKFDHDQSAMLQRKHYKEILAKREEYCQKKVLLLTRDIKDTLVSAYFQATKRINIFNGSISDFLYDDHLGAYKILSFYKSWIQSKHIPGEIMVASYEDLHSNTHFTVKKILNFIGISSIDENMLAEAIHHCSFDNMKKMEKNQYFSTSALRAANTNDNDSYKVRSGKVGAYHEHLSDDDIFFIDTATERFKIDLNDLKSRLSV